MRRIVGIDAENGGFVVEIFNQKIEEENNKPSKKGNIGPYKDPYRRYVFKDIEREQMMEFLEKVIKEYKIGNDSEDVFDKAFNDFSKEEKEEKEDE